MMKLLKIYVTDILCLSEVLLDDNNS